MSWRLAVIAMGGLTGTAVSASVWADYQAALAVGQDPAGLGFGVSHWLFLISFPWSLAVWLVDIPVALLKWALTGSQGGPWLLASFFLMPVVAGAGWAWLALRLAARLRRRSANGPSADEAARPSA